MGAVSILRDVTETMRKTEELVYAAGHDSLTGLPNRNLLNSLTQRAIVRAQRQRFTFALLFLDLDRFKEINDTMGHAAGDALLINVARRLSRMCSTGSPQPFRSVLAPAFSPTMATTREALLSHADAAMYRTKKDKDFKGSNLLQSR